MTRDYRLSGTAELPENMLRFPRQSSTPGPISGLDWMDDPALLVPQPGARLLGPKGRIYVGLAVLFVLGGALVGLT